VWKSNDASYTGEWVNDEKTGAGLMTDKHGSYTGEWKNNQRHGKGKITWITGETYEGEWKNDHMEGEGIYTWPEGKQPTAMKNAVQYKGSFRNDMFHGYGKCYNVAGKLVKKGYWAANRFYGRKKQK
jgi:hypothetical protein